MSVINIKKIFIMVALVLGIFIGIFVVFRISLYFVPFIIAFIISLIIDPIIRLLVNKVKLPRKLAAFISLLFVLSSLGLLLTLLISRLISEIVSISHLLPAYFTDMYTNIDSLIDRASDLYLGLPVEVTKNIEGIISNLSAYLLNILNSFLKGILNTAVSIPEAVVFTLVTILSSYFIASDREIIYGFFKAQLPELWFDKIRSIKNDLFSALFGYVRAQLIMMSITFTELSIGFSIIGIKHFILIAFVISFIDALPILGTGGILVPWAIYSFLTGNIKMGLSLLVIYGIVLVVRQMIEPKVLSQQIGVHPLLTLLAMYTGLKLFGVGGLILGPITVLLLKNILTGMMKNRAFKDLFNKTSAT